MTASQIQTYLDKLLKAIKEGLDKPALPDAPED